MLRGKCDGVVIRKTGEIVDCPRKPTHLTDELIRYCDTCFAEYERARANVDT